LSTFHVSGFVQSVALSPFDNNLMFVATNNKKLRVRRSLAHILVPSSTSDIDLC
jgi:hypothetical protein